MENASKALLMAGGVLLGMMIISLAVLLFTNFGGTSSQIHTNIEQNQISQFNSQFTAYVGKNNVTIYDVISMANLATENNKYYELSKPTTVTGNDNYITVILDGRAIEFGDETVDNTYIEQYYNEKISEQVNAITIHSTELAKYNVQVEVSQVTRRVYKVICNKIT